MATLPLSRTRRITVLVAVALVIALGTSRSANALSYVFAGETFGVDVVAHPVGYTGSGGTLTVTVGIDPTSLHASSMMIPTQNVIIRWNQLQATTGNLENGTIPFSSFDFESVLLHEMGHALGLAHVNLASESGLTGADQNYTKSTDGPDNVFNLNAGSDGVRGTADDIRGDDVNLNYFKIVDNNPFTLPGSGIIDSTTYSRDTNLLPGTDSFSVNADRTVATTSPFNFPNTESVMQQGTFNNETQRTLTADDVAAIRYAASGVDELQGTADDYTLNLVFAGLDDSADIVIDFDNSQTGFAVAQFGGIFIGPTDHIRLTSPNIYFNDGFSWHFNAELVPEPSTYALGIIGLLAFAAFGWRVRRRRVSLAVD